MFEGEALIRKAGYSEQGKVSIEVQPIRAGTTFNFVFHPAPDALQKEYLSIALTAITANKRVFCKMADENSDLSQPGPPMMLITLVGYIRILVSGRWAATVV